MEGIYTTSTLAVVALSRLLKQHGLTPDKIAKNTGIQTAKLDFPNLRITLQQMNRLWKFAIAVTGDPALGLHLRPEYNENFTHFVTSLIRNAETLLEAARLLCRYSSVISDYSRIELVESDNHYELVFFYLAPQFHCISIIEHDIALTLSSTGGFTGRQTKPPAIHFVHPAPSYADEYGKVFNCPVHFGMDQNRILIRKKTLQWRHLPGNPHLKATLKKHAETLLEEQAKRQTLTGRVEKFIMSNLAQGRADIESAAATMHMSRSTLHRKLKQEGRTFKNILSHIRKDLSITYLGYHMSFEQIADLLGFADSSTFQHAFKRWHGKSPGEYKKNAEKNDGRRHSS